MTQVGMEFIARDRSRAGVNSFRRNITTMTRSVLRLAGIGGGLYMLRGSLKSVWDATLKQESAEKALEAAVGDSISTYKKYASQLQKLTIYGDEEILNQMAYARNLGVTADKLNEAAVAAIGLAAKYRLDLSASMMLVGRASQGQTQMLTRYGIVMDESLSDQEKFNELLKMGAEAFSLAEAKAAESEGTIAQLSNTWGDLQEVVGEQFVPTAVEGLGRINSILQDNDRLIKRYIKDFREGVEVQLEIQKITRQMMKPWWMQGYEIYKGTRQKPPAAPDTGMVDWSGDSWKIEQDQAAEQRQDLVKVAERTNAVIVADTREKLKSIRAMDYLTRMEKIENLKAYVAAHAADMQQVAEAEKLLNDEVLALQLSRLDAMAVYRAELREDMQNTALYISEKYAEASRSIEGSLSGAFESMIADGASFRDAMSRFFDDVSRAFARMAADMAARAMMDAWIAPLMSGLAGGLGGLFGGGTPNAAYSAAPYPVHHQGWVPEGVPSFHGGRNLKNNERVAVIEDDELLAPGDKVIRSRTGGAGGGAAPSIIIYNESGQSIGTKGEPEFDGESWVVSLIAQNYTQGGSLKKLMK